MYCCIFDSLPKISLSDFSDFIVAVTSIAALFISIHTIKRESVQRQKDEHQRIKQQEKEDKIKKWNALYPHRLQFFTDFYDVLFRFVNYTGTSVERLRQSNIKGTETRIERTMRVADITEFCSLFNKFAEEANVLFNKNIQRDIHSIYELVNNFVRCPIEGKNNSLSDYYAILDNNIRFPEYQQIIEQLHIVQEKVRDIKLETSLRNEFKRSMELKDESDE